MSSEKQSQSLDGGASGSGPVAMERGAGEEDDRSLLRPCGVGEWDTVWLGRTDYLDSGPERDWSFRDVETVNGEVINVSDRICLASSCSGVYPGLPWIYTSEESN